ncbi:MAG TPA: bifunctional (p)ppGpp synthetase/guanosine-3',5'-bis(diphosphate) 3'-pyrophosphohydrolase [Candidatus Faecalibacterium avium]|uniref:RelA/SpoT family protein n=1 Tax=Faecalibacterium sp. An58 TaxID=1965648 RepID=UPI000B39B730|nr:bifunctional (p)ppGpp synthetase/guanosine-3',5'-bis(diphosphate) 3'-pyrophosphohydrolase [Faecalibacterium sp. An58]OUN74544.1 (p)ppGpp synthetase [Faecalibacterium sp. An58]HIV42764.1 bifunctional (p)ppGpp synthetase/guanosine-3',5'-bis(diphosphate) 3'-pyrophosphohydrolase [Candidatus Faecalibacterium avium]
MPEGKKTAVPAPAQDSYTAKSHLQHQVREIGTVAATARPAEAVDYMVPSEARPEIITYDKLMEAIQASGRPYNMEMIEKAYHTADQAHQNVRRRSGEPYICHPLAVARLVLDLGMDSESVAAALLHDVVEDTPITVDEIKSSFGADVALLVDGVTKLTKIQFSSIEEQQAENLRKMLLAMSQDVRVMIIKLCDRLHNMRTGDAWPEQKRRDKARETMEVYAPIANRLGILNIKEELEDRSLHYLDPVGYEEISKLLSERAGEEFLAGVSSLIEKRLEESGIKGAAMKRRVKSIYGIYRKMFIQNKSFDEIYDIYAVRIILDTITECYSALGLIHDMYHPLPNRFKDYISTPKPNGYQSLHTTVIGHEGIPFEVQIRTRQMDEQAEYGVAAHWKYKEGIGGHDKLDERLAWVRQLLENQRVSEDSGNLLHDLKSDLLPEEVFAFTPKGDVINLPAGATCIDFAYAIHSAVGNRMVGCKVNNRMVPIDHVVATGEIIEVILGPADKGPSRDWLKIVKTSEAKSKIRNWFKKMRRDENISEGRDALAKELRREGILIPDDKLDEFVGGCCRRMRQNSAEDLYAAIGYGGITIANCIPKFKEEYQKLRAAENPPVELPKVDLRKVHSTDGVVVEGFDNTPIKFAKCCNPLPGDPIVGFLTRGFGVSIHKANCVNAVASQKDPANAPRWVKAYWADSVKDSYKAGLEIVALDRNDLLKDVLNALSDMRVPIYTMNARQTDNYGVVNLTIGINNTDHLDRVVARLAKIKDVLKVTRG